MDVWLVGWLGGCLACGVDVWLVGWLTGCLAWGVEVWLVGWLSEVGRGRLRLIGDWQGD